jgi:ribosomal protein S3
LLFQFFARTLAKDGYAGVEVRVTPIRTEIIVKATKTDDVVGEKGRRIKELTSVIQKRCVTCQSGFYLPFICGLCAMSELLF